jgi:hypothetical protein
VGMGLRPQLPSGSVVNDLSTEGHRVKDVCNVPFLLPAGQGFHALWTYLTHHPSQVDGLRKGKIGRMVPIEKGR